MYSTSCWGWLLGQDIRQFRLDLHVNQMDFQVWREVLRLNMTEKKLYKNCTKKM